MKKLAALLTLLISFQLQGLSFAENRNVEINGFLLGNYTGRVTGLQPEGDSGDFIIGEERLRLDALTWADSIRAEARVRVDVFHDAVGEEFDVDIREAYIDYTLGPVDLRLGRQITTWGVGDLIFINDVWPKDWVSFFSGRPLEYLKLGVDGFRARYSSKAINAELIVVPFFTPDNMPGHDRFFFFDPFVDVPTHVEDRPDDTFENVELGLRIYRSVANFDVSLYVYRGFWLSPSIKLDNFIQPTTVTIHYPDLAVYGASAQGNIFGGVLSLEGGYYHSREDEDGTDPLIPNSQGRFLVGYQMQPLEDMTVGVQYYTELMDWYGSYEDSLPPGFPKQEYYRDVVTLRLGQMLLHQTLDLSLFAYYGIADNDYLIQPAVTYKFSDRLAGTVGGNIFGGEENHTFFGQFDKNDNVYLSVRFDF